LKYNSDIANEHDRLILESLGLNVKSDGTVKCPCPIHQGDNKNGFSYNPKLKVWKCWTQQCHETHGSDLIGLVRGIKQMSFPQAARYIMDLVNPSSRNDTFYPTHKNKKYIKQRTKSTPKSSIHYPISILDGVDHNVDYFLQRGISYQTLAEFKAFLCTTKGKSLYGRACIPIIHNDHIVGFTGRKTNIIRNSSIKWLHHPSDALIHNYLLGLNMAQPYISQSGICILVEGPMDVLKLWDCNIKNVVSVMGNTLSKHQRQLLLNIGVRTVVLLFDPDDGGNTGLENLIKSCRLYFNLINLSDRIYNDPGDMSQDEIYKYISPDIDRIVCAERTYGSCN